MKHRLTSTLVLAISLFVLGRPVSGQGIPVLQQGDLEVGVFGAFNFGAGLGILARNLAARGTNPINIVTPSSNGSVGAQFNWAPAWRIRLYTEASYPAFSI